MLTTLLLLLSSYSITSIFAITLDGTLDTAYGSALAVQGVESNYGDDKNELDAAYASIDTAAKKLYLFIAGNVEGTPNSNAVKLFIDGLNGFNVAPSFPPIKFDAGFAARWELAFRVTNLALSLDFAERASLGANLTASASATYNAATGLSATGSLSAANIAFVLNNNNAGKGVGGQMVGTANVAATAANALAVTTGLEIELPLAMFDSKITASSIRVTAVLGNAAFDNWSNQALASYPAGVVTPSTTPDFAAASGNQFFTIPNVATTVAATTTTTTTTAPVSTTGSTSTASTTTTTTNPIAATSTTTTTGGQSSTTTTNTVAGGSDSDSSAPTSGDATTSTTTVDGASGSTTVGGSTAGTGADTTADSMSIVANLMIVLILSLVTIA